MAEEDRKIGAVRVATESIAGLRPYQEDAVIALALPNGRVLAAVADGMGGHAAGEVASARAMETLVEALQDGEALRPAFQRANARVNAEAEDPHKRGMGTTLVAALIVGGTCEIANVGDSRCYLITGSGIRQITEDHSFVTEAMKRGQTEEEAMASQWRHALTRSIGTEPTVDVDVFGPFPLDPDATLLLCSDGLCKSLGDGDILEILRREPDTDAAAKALVAEALSRGSDDNITVALLASGTSTGSRGPDEPAEGRTPGGSDGADGASGTGGAGGMSGAGGTSDDTRAGGLGSADGPRLPPRFLFTALLAVLLLVLAFELVGR